MKKLLYSIVAASLTLAAIQPAQAQLVPEPWVSVGSQDGETTFSVGARAFNLGVELGFGEDDSTGVDALAFLDVPLVSRIRRVSPYVGVGLYSDDQVAVSGGVQVAPTRNLTLGVGYHTERGVNGQVGVRF